MEKMNPSQQKNHQEGDLETDKDGASETNPGSWQDKYHNALMKIIENPDTTLNDVVEVTWEKGILDRVCPLDEDLKKKRLEAGRNTFEGDRNDPELYWRILGAMENLRRSINQTLSGGYCSAAVTGFFNIYDPKNIDRFFPSRDSKNWQNDLLGYFDLFSQKARVELRTRNEQVPEHLPQVGARGKYRDMPVNIQSIGSDGTVSLQADNPIDHMKIYDLSQQYGNGYGGVSLKDVCESFVETAGD